MTRAKVCFELKDGPFSYADGVVLIQNGIDNFTVKYGKSVKAGLSYNKAALNLGASIMHALACEGKLDNREKGEK